MFIQIVQFETTLSREEAIAVAEGRIDAFRAVPGLVQKHYLQLGKPNHFAGFYMWESLEAMQAFRASDLAKTIPAAYKVVGAPDVEVAELMFSLREDKVAA